MDKPAPSDIALQSSHHDGWLPGGQSLWKSQQSGQLCPNLGDL